MVTKGRGGSAQRRAPVEAERIVDDDFELLVGVAARLNRTSAVILGSLDVPLTFRQYRTLTRVLSGYTSPSQLAKRGNLSLPTVSENVEGLVKRGLMETEQSATDRRAITLRVTGAGARAAQAGHRALSEFVASLLVGFDDEERRAFVAQLRRVYDAATDYFTEQVIGKAGTSLDAERRPP